MDSKKKYPRQAEGDGGEEMNVKSIVRELKQRQHASGKERDALRKLVSSADELQETCERAYEDLGNAISALSELA